MTINCEDTPKSVIIDQMNEPRPLPMGRADFHEWSDRIIAGALLPDECGKVFEMSGQTVWDENSPYPKFVQSQKFALANQLLHLGQTESHKPDAYFIHGLRVSAIKQVAVTIGNEMRDAVKARLAKEAEEAEREDA